MADSFVSKPSSVKGFGFAVLRKRINTLNIAAALDKTKVSDRNAAYILAAAAKSLYISVDIVINRDSRVNTTGNVSLS